ncbi:hypothetical protein BDV10DRAFT_194131 [Aspergillus recurvatus]
MDLAPYVPRSAARLINRQLELTRGLLSLSILRPQSASPPSWITITPFCFPRSNSSAPQSQLSSTRNMPPKQKKQPADPRPSSSVVLISPKNEILLLHRVKSSTSFASAHVFPGGNLSLQDGRCPPPGDPRRHEDASWYRNAAIRELFEESGILLAKNQGSGKMLAVGENERERGRSEIHKKQTTFSEWLKKQNSSARYTTQMYLYFLPLPLESEKSLLSEIPAEGEREEIQIPTSDGGVEIAEAQFLPASEWLGKATRGEIILFPPQFVLLSLAAQFLDKEPRTVEPDELQRRRTQFIDFAHSGSPPWTEKCISPKVGKFAEDGRAVLTLEHPGPELEGTDRRGDPERAVFVRFRKGSARELSLAWKKDIFPGRKSSL